MATSVDAWTEPSNAKALADAKLLFGSKLLESTRAQTAVILEELVAMEAGSGATLLPVIVEIVGAKNAHGKPAYTDRLPHMAQIVASPTDSAEVKQLALTLLRDRERGSSQSAADLLAAARKSLKS